MAETPNPSPSPAEMPEGRQPEANANDPIVPLRSHPTFRVVLMLIIGMLMTMQSAFDMAPSASRWVNMILDLRVTVMMIGYLMITTAFTYLTKKIRFAGFNIEKIISEADDNPISASITFFGMSVFEGLVVVAGALLIKG